MTQLVNLIQPVSSSSNVNNRGKINTGPAVFIGEEGQFKEILAKSRSEFSGSGVKRTDFSWIMELLKKPVKEQQKVLKDMEIKELKNLENILSLLLKKINKQPVKIHLDEADSNTLLVLQDLIDNKFINLDKINDLQRLVLLNIELKERLLKQNNGNNFKQHVSGNQHESGNGEELKNSGQDLSNKTTIINENNLPESSVKQEVQGQDKLKVEVKEKATYWAKGETGKLEKENTRIVKDEKGVIIKEQIAKRVINKNQTSNAETNKQENPLTKEFTKLKTDDSTGNRLDFKAVVKPENDGNSVDSKVEQFNTSKEPELNWFNISNRVNYTRVDNNNQSNQQTRMADVIRQITEQIKISKQAGNKEVEIQLEPRSLGKIKVNLKVEGGKVLARMVVENHEVKNFLENNLVNLRGNLIRQGFSIDQINIEAENYSELHQDDNLNQHSNQEENQAGGGQTGEETGELNYDELEELFKDGSVEISEDVRNRIRWSIYNYNYHRMNLLA